MTIERPMFPPRGDDRQVIQFAEFAAAKKLAKADHLPQQDGGDNYLEQRRAKHAARLEEVTQAPENFSETCRNHRLRLSRRDAWWAAHHLTDYWHARMKWNSALSTAQCHGIADANSFPKCDDYGSGRQKLVDLWRAALVSQMLTPAPDQAAVNWKLAKLKANDHCYTDVKQERLQRAIDADVEWLKAHPSRKSIAASRQAKKDDRS